MVVRRGSCRWDVDHAGWVVTPYVPDQQTSFGKSLEEGLVWRRVWLMIDENGVGQFAR